MSKRRAAAKGPSDRKEQSEVWKLLVAAVLPLAVGAVGYFVTPLRSVIMDWIWKEDVELRIHAPSTPQQDGDEFDLHLWAIPRTPVAVSAGLLMITAQPEGVLQLLGGETGIAVPSIAAPASLTSQDRPVRVVALNAGQATVTATLKTGRGEYRTSAVIDVTKRAPTGRPSHSDYTGSWVVNIGPYTGSMELSDRGRTFFGKYAVSGGPAANGGVIHGTIEGVHDGGIFNASAFRGNATRKWLIIACIRRYGTDVELEGDATPHTAQGDHWVPKGDKLPFWAGSAQTDRRRRKEAPSPCEKT